MASKPAMTENKDANPRQRRIPWKTIKDIRFATPSPLLGITFTLPMVVIAVVLVVRLVGIA
jgi:hypothetical protein